MRHSSGGWRLWTSQGYIRRNTKVDKVKIVWRDSVMRHWLMQWRQRDHHTMGIVGQQNMTRQVAITTHWLKHSTIEWEIRSFQYLLVWLSNYQRKNRRSLTSILSNELGSNNGKRQKQHTRNQSAAFKQAQHKTRLRIECSLFEWATGMACRTEIEPDRTAAIQILRPMATVGITTSKGISLGNWVVRE